MFSCTLKLNELLFIYTRYVLFTLITARGSAKYCSIQTYTMPYITCLFILLFYDQDIACLALFLLREGLSPSFVNVFPCPAHLLLQRHPQSNPLIPPLLHTLAYQRILLRSKTTLLHLIMLYQLVFSITVSC